MNVKKNKKGFTLMEMLIVVAIIAVLVAIAIPVLSNNLHKAKVAADWANLRSYYAYLQADLIQTGELVDEIDGIPFRILIMAAARIPKLYIRAGMR